MWGAVGLDPEVGDWVLAIDDTDAARVRFPDEE